MITVVHADEIAGWRTPPPHARTLKVLLSPSRQPVSAGLGIGMVILPPGETSTPHTHDSEQEVWYVISGSGLVRVGQETARLRPDTIVVAPAGVEHQLSNDGDTDLKAIWLFTPAGPELQYLPPEGER